MNIKNAVILLGFLLALLGGLGWYTNYVLKDILVASITQETTKVINTNNNDIMTKIDNKFKKIESLTTDIQTALPISTAQENSLPQTKDTNCIPNGYTLVNDSRLSRKILREKKKTGANIFH